MFYTNVYRHGDTLYVRYIGKNRGVRKIKFAPKLYGLPGLVGTDSIYSTQAGDPLKEIPFECMSDAFEFVKRYKDVAGVSLYGQTDYATQWICDKFPGKIEYDSRKILVYNMDIEVYCEEGFPEPDVADWPINAITVYSNKDCRYHCWMMRDFNAPDNVNFTLKLTEEDMLLSFLDFWAREYPDVVTGWSTSVFDIPYLYNRIKKLLGKHHADKLSPYGIIKTRTMRANNSDSFRTVLDLAGIADLDYMVVYRKFYTKQQENFSLNYISSIVLKDPSAQKVAYKGSLAEFYKRDPQRFLEYNIQDVALVQRIHEKLHLLDIIFDVTYMAKLPRYEIALKTLQPWENMIYDYMRANNKMPKIKAFEDDVNEEGYEGAFVKEPKIGAYKWLISLDLNSLYPNIARQWNISPETLCTYDIPEKYRGDVPIDDIVGHTADFAYLKDLDVCRAANGAYYRRDLKGMLPIMFGEIYNQRKAVKKEMLRKETELEEHPELKDVLAPEIAAMNARQNALKVLINGAYGALGNPRFLYHRIENAHAITKTGQMVILWVEKRMNAWMREQTRKNRNYAIYCDTDSLYVDMNDIVVAKGWTNLPKTEIVDKIDAFVESEIGPRLDSWFEDMFDYMNCVEPTMAMKRETIAESGVWTSKKRYALLVHDNEGVRYAEPKIKITGLESVRSSTPAITRKHYAQAVELILNNPDDNEVLIKFNESTRKNFENAPLSDLGRPIGVKDMDKFIENGKYRRGTPIHVKGAHNFNQTITRLGLEKKYKKIISGDKIKFIKLKAANPTREPVIAFKSGDDIPPEFGLDQYVDFEQQFEDIWIKPITAVCRAIGWTYEHVDTLDSAFDDDAICAPDEDPEDDYEFDALEAAFD